MNTENTKRNNSTLYYIQRYGIWIAAALLICVLPLKFRSGFALSLMSQAGIAIIFSLSYNMLLGQGGMLSFGHAVFYGLGGFITTSPYYYWTSTEENAVVAHDLSFGLDLQSTFLKQLKARVRAIRSF